MNYNSEACSPIYPLPMSNADFDLAQQSALQQRILNDPEMQREMIRHSNQMVRDANKNILRERHQKSKQKSCQIVCENNGVYLSIFNGLNVRIEHKVLFGCQVKEVRCYHFDGMDGCFWQAILTEQNGKSAVVSELYDSYWLELASRLKNTILCKYICVHDHEGCRIAWQWMFEQLSVLYEKASIIELPYKAGWFKTEDQWRFWTNSEDALLLSEQVEKFSVRRFSNLDVTTTISSFLDSLPAVSDDPSIPAVLWIFRMASLLGRLTGAVPLEIGLTIVGEQSMAVAKKFLRVMDNDVDITNLDSCRLTDIKKQAKLLQDTPLIFVSSNPNNRSTQNRIEEVHSWIDTGYIGGKEVALPFIFCIQKFAREYPLDGTVIVDSYKIKKVSDYTDFSKFQSLIISNIEKSGAYWVNELQNEYARQVESEKPAMALYRTVNNIVQAMFERELNETTKCRFKELIRLGEEEIDHQLSLQYGILMDTFRKYVWQLVDNNALSVADRNKCAYNPSDMQIFYDDMFYYLTRKVFDFICQKSNIDTKTELAIKQQLVECEYVRTYKNSGTHNRELEIDITIGNSDGQKNSISVLAIEREFFDELGGVALFERGQAND